MSSPESTENLISSVDIDNLAVSNLLLEESNRPEDKDDGGFWNGFKGILGRGLQEFAELAVAVIRGGGSTPRSLASFGQYASDQTPFELPLVSRIDGLSKEPQPMSTRIDFASLNPETYRSPYIASTYRPVG